MARFQIATDHDCLSKYLNMIGIVQVPCVNCVTPSKKRRPLIRHTAVVSNLDPWGEEVPGHLSTSDLVSERLILPRIPFTQIRRLRHVLGQFGILEATWKILKDHCQTVTRARTVAKGNSAIEINFLEQNTNQGEDIWNLHISCKDSGTRLQEAGHKLDDLYIGFQLIKVASSEFESTVQQIYRWKEKRTSELSKIEAELILLEANRLQVDETRFGESGECLLEQFHFEEVEDVTWCYGCSSWRSKWQE
ncbi:retrovirus-related Pol polyprotein from transposon TNT 1-94 [Trichonephila clavipes]|nr:retrovirus-related Pol polyprotein from transposon TNT 1-94 [Trichonephila clavipes]